MDTDAKIDQVKGKAEQAVGNATDDQDLQAKGERHETGGKLKEALSDAKDKVADAIDSVEKKIDNISDSNKDESTK